MKKLIKTKEKTFTLSRLTEIKIKELAKTESKKSITKINCDSKAT